MPHTTPWAQSRIEMIPKGAMPIATSFRLRRIPPSRHCGPCLSEFRGSRRGCCTASTEWPSVVHRCSRARCGGLRPPPWWRHGLNSPLARWSELSFLLPAYGPPPGGAQQQKPGSQQTQHRQASIEIHLCTGGRRPGGAEIRAFGVQF